MKQTNLSDYGWSTLPQKEEKALQFLKQFPPENTAVSFSGGKDSLVALHLAKRAGISRAVFADTTMMADEEIEYVKDIGEVLGVQVDIVRPKKTFWEFVEDFGTPSVRGRWCCAVLKYAPLSEYAKQYGIKYYITGLRREESLIRRNYTKTSKNPMMPLTIEVNPILNWTKDEVWNYIHRYNLPVPPAYKKGLLRTGCLFCPFASPKFHKKLRELYPEEWAKFDEAVKNYALRVHATDIEQFVEKGWRVFRIPKKKTVVGWVGPDGELKMKEGFNREFKLLKILDPENPPKRYRQKVRILVEKELNCVGCGACVALCPTDALFINESGKIDLHEEECAHCYQCTDTTLLKRACVARDFKLELFIVETRRG